MWGNENIWSKPDSSRRIKYWARGFAIASLVHLCLPDFEQPGWPSGSDQNPELGAETRARLLDKAASDGMRLIGFHLPGGGIGRVERHEGAFRFVGEEA